MKFLFLLLLAAPAYAGTAFFKYEIPGNLYKTCVYDYMGDDISITISSVSLCPLTIQVP